MSEKVKVPPVGESIEEVTISSWRKKDGEYVDMDEVVAELESDKASFELTAPQAGILKITKQEGDTLPIGEVVCEIDTSAKPEASKKATAPAPPVSSSPTPTGEVKEMRVPEVGESVTEVTISGWHKKNGDRVALDETIAEVESDKTTFDLPAEAQGILEIVAREGDTLPIGGLICKIQVEEGASPVGQPSQSVANSSPKSRPSAGKSYAAGHPAPAAKKILKEKGVSPSQVEGTGVGGRITKEDAVQSQPASPDGSPSEAVLPSTVGDRKERREKVSTLRKTIARRLVAVKNETAMLTTFNEVDMKFIMDLRARYKERFKEKYEVGLGFMSFFVKAVCFALKEFPAINAYLDGSEVVYHDYCDVSIAVSTPRGLVVPVIRNAEMLSMDEIESEVARLASRGRDGKLSIEEMTGGTFSITNGGVFGSMLSTPILNPPQSAILGMHNIVQRPVVVDQEVAVRPIMYLALSYDHRIVDGKESVSFLMRVKEMLEDPTRLVLGI